MTAIPDVLTTTSTTSPQVRRLDLLLGGSVLIFLVATWKLWLPHGVFPRVPLLAWAPPQFMDWLACGVMVLGSLGLIAVPRQRRWAAVLIASGFGLAFLGDQLRLQPWAWQLFLVSLLGSLATPALYVMGWRGLVISIYVYSALSKCDAAFLSGSGWDMLEPLHAWLPFRAHQGSFWPLLMPLGELLVAIWLGIPRTRRWGRYASYGLHGGLLLLLGPLGLNHSRGVLLWNVFFLVQNRWLFATPVTAAAPALPADSPQPRWRQLLAWGVLVVASCWPAFYPWGWCDPWIGWAVYAPPFERVTVSVRVPSAAKLPPDWPDELRRPQTAAGTLDDDFLTGSFGTVVDFNRWSLSTLGVPTYPGPRYRVALAMALSEKLDSHAVTVRFDRRFSRWQAKFPATPTRVSSTREDLERTSRQFWFNAQPVTDRERSAR